MRKYSTRSKGSNGRQKTSSRRTTKGNRKPTKLQRQVSAERNKGASTRFRKRPTGTTIRVGRRQVRALPLTGHVKRDTNLHTFLSKEGYFEDRADLIKKLKTSRPKRARVDEVSMKTVMAGGGMKAIGNKFQQAMEKLAA